MIISVLANDLAQPGYASEHGLSIHVSHPEHEILFDTGHTDVYLKNAQKMAIDLSMVHHLVLSHGHYDHMGGLRFFPKENHIKSVILHQDAFIPKYAHEETIRYNGAPFKKRDIKWARSLYKEIDNFEEIAPCFYVFGNIPNNRQSMIYFAANQHDDFHDELMLVLEEEGGLTLLMGCAHFGVIEGLNLVKAFFPNKQIINLIAGMHLNKASMSEIEYVADALEASTLEKIIPLHCTGTQAMDYFKKRLKNRCHLLRAGDQIKL